MLTYDGETAQTELIYKGAEAEIYRQTWLRGVAVRKTRTPKPYRIPELDDAIRRTRTVHEANMMREARKLEVPVPTILHIDTGNCSLIMDYVRGLTLKDELQSLPTSAKRNRLQQLGTLLARMHEGGIVHGDMTISNVLSEDGKLVLIDFGLGDFSRELEDRGVDVLLLHRAIRSTHYASYGPLSKAFMKGYLDEVGRKKTDEVFQKMKEVERRGRYFERT